MLLLDLVHKVKTVRIFPRSKQEHTGNDRSGRGRELDYEAANRSELGLCIKRMERGSLRRYMGTNEGGSSRRDIAGKVCEVSYQRSEEGKGIRKKRWDRANTR